MVRKYMYTASIILFAISFSQNKKKLPDNVFANLRFVVKKNRAIGPVFKINKL